MANVVLVHGLWVDGSSWRLVTEGLQEGGHNVTAVQLPHSSLTDDVAEVRRVLARQEGPTILVGHCYGGAVISGAAHGSSQVTGLVYVAAAAPAEGETALEAMSRFSPGWLHAALADAEGPLTLPRERFRDVLAADVPDYEARVMAASQKPVAEACLTEMSGPVAWRRLPSWYVLCTQDRLVTPETQTWMIDRLGANPLTIDASHAIPVSQPALVTEAIEGAARKLA
ncbi:alpha/beta fold hydrolase [Streptomyces sp. NPDC091376]|uniref:alpha/beta fold hydrolase n=1 Tax=Streptomyces sp. NPDC091376 TaxID=3365994 RepID=UPI0037F88BE9